MTPRSPRHVETSLKGLIFAQIFTMGCVYPLVSLYMQTTLHFDALATGFVLAGSTIAAITTPLVAAFIADRLVSSRILLLICMVLVALANLALVFSHDFTSFFWSWLLMSVAQGPVGGLINTLSFHHLEDGVKRYGPVRLWGTVGWISAGWLLSLAWLVLPLVFPGTGTEAFQPLMFVLAVVGAGGTALLCLTLPGGGVRVPERPGLQGLVPTEALKTVKSRLFVTLMVMALGNSIMDRFFFFGAAPYLPVAGFPEGTVMAVMTVGQLVELPILAILGAYITKMGFRNGLLVGLVLQALRPLLLAIPGPVSAVAGLALHGVLVGFVQLSIVMQANQECSPSARSGMNQIFAFVYGGIANLAGSLGAGYLMNAVRVGLPASVPSDQGVWSGFWLGNAGIGVALVVAFFLLYPKKGETTGRKPDEVAG